MFRHTLYVAGDVRGSLKGLLDYLVEKYGGATVTRAHGYWRHEGKTFDEWSNVIDVIVPEDVDAFDTDRIDAILARDTSELAYAVAYSNGTAQIRYLSR